MVIMGNKKTPKNAEIMFCKFCDFTCFKNSDWDRHILRLKHKNNEKGYQMVTETVQKTPENAEKYYACQCGNLYKHNSGLSRHKKKCNKNELYQETELYEENELYKENELYQKVHFTQLTSLITELVKSNAELQKSVMDVCKNGSNNILINNTVSNNNNKTFNLNVFLNEECKDAMNIMDFVDSLKLQISDLENVGKMGFINGISNIIIKNLKAMDVHKRPVHCSDAKREIMYIKDEDKWEKENEERKKLKKAIKHIAHKNSKMLQEFKAKYPDCIYSDSKKSDQYNKIIIEAMGGHGDNDDEKEDKIIKNIAKEVLINKT